MSMIDRIGAAKNELETKTGVKPVKVRMGRTAYNALREEMGGEPLRIHDMDIELCAELDSIGEPIVVTGDEINSPQHYKLFPDMDVIDVIEQTLDVEEFRGYLKGNILKYRLRAGEKGPPEKCLGKANWYRRKLDDHEANWPTCDEFKKIVNHIDVSNADDGFAVEADLSHLSNTDALLSATLGTGHVDPPERNPTAPPRWQNDSVRFKATELGMGYGKLADHFDAAYERAWAKVHLCDLPLPVLTERLKTIQAEFRRRGLAVTLTVEPLRDVKPDDGN